MCKEMRDLNNNLLHLLSLLCFNFKYLKRLFAKPLIDMKRQENVLLETNFRDYIFISPSTLWVTWLLGKQFSYCQASEVINKWMLCWISVSVRTLYRTHNLKLAGLLWIQLKYLRKKVGNKYIEQHCQLVAFTCWSIFNNSKIHAQYWIITPNKHVLKVPYISQANQYMHTEYFGPVALCFWINIMAGVKEMQVRLKTILNCSHFYK